MSHYRHAWIGLLCLCLLGLDFPKLKTGEERVLKNFQNALLHYNAREYSLAREKLLNVLSAKDDFPLARLYLSRTLYQSGEWLESLSELEELRKTSPKDSVTVNRIELLKMELGGFDLTSSEKSYYQSIQGDEHRGFRFRNPVDIKLDESGNLYLLSFGTTSLIKYDPNLTPIWISQGGFSRQMKGPVAMDYWDGRFFVADFPSDYIYIFDKKGNFKERIGSTGSELNQFRGPNGIAIDPIGNTYISDIGNQRVVKWNKMQKPLFAFGQFGQGKLNQPAGIGWFKNEIYVIEKSNPRILVYDEEGNYLRSLNSKYFKKPRSLEFIQDKIYISDEISGLIEFNPKTTSYKTMDKFKDLSGKYRNIDRIFAARQDRYGYLYTTDFNRHRIDLFAPINFRLSNLNLEIEKIDTSRFPNITLFLNLKNRRGQSIRGLKREDFAMIENANDKSLFELKNAQNWNNRITVSMVFENSDSVIDGHKRFQSWMQPFFDKMTREDRIELIRADQDSTKILPFTVSERNLFKSIRTSTPQENFHTGKSIYLSIGNLSKELGPRAIVIFTSGKNSLSTKQYPLQKIIQYARAQSIQIYPITLEKPDSADESWNFLAEGSGGKLFSLDEVIEEDLYDLIKSHMDERYFLSYSTETKSSITGRWIPLELTVKYRDFGGKTEGGYFVP
ncbi:6-bladed beta-propeller [Leptospira sp. GIMC2001]|uniref:6-bladed beta-propeller n=1 Tax=Leptospira sp. GIMC2001 TaxID=1513297 RepID=UPI00234BAE6E|nr:6-bladed beta-propeller [Leptospira sp. GIMC2001]WCL48044.1 6-bladed beta-propeller [Leptospira sp. GIMC2001]